MSSVLERNDLDELMAMVRTPLSSTTLEDVAASIGIVAAASSQLRGCNAHLVVRL